MMNVNNLQAIIIKTLRSNRYTQIFGHTHNGLGKHFCVIGMIGYIVNHNPGNASDACRAVGIKDVNRYVQMNNQGMTFKELARLLIIDYNFPDVYPDDYIHNLLNDLEITVPEESYLKKHVGAKTEGLTPRKRRELSPLVEA